MQKQNISMSRFGTNQAVTPHQELQPPKMFVEPCHLWAKLNSNANDCCKCNFLPNVVLLPTSWILDLTSLFPCSFIEWTQYRSLFCCCCWKLSHWSWCAPFYWMFEWILSWKESRNVKVVFLCFTGFPVCLESGRKGCAGAETRTDEWYQLWKHSHLFFSFSSFPLAHALTTLTCTLQRYIDILFYLWKHLCTLFMCPRMSPSLKPCTVVKWIKGHLHSNRGVNPSLSSSQGSGVNRPRGRGALRAVWWDRTEAEGTVHAGICTRPRWVTNTHCISTLSPVLVVALVFTGSVNTEELMQRFKDGSSSASLSLVIVEGKCLAF